jgi:XRE family transcriptional regulator, regulator of sulfur utilization
MPADPLAGAMLYRAAQYGGSMAAVGDLDEVNGRMARAIRAHRQSRGLSLGALATASDLSKTILGKIEAGQGTPRWRLCGASRRPSTYRSEPDRRRPTADDAPHPTRRGIPCRIRLRHDRAPHPRRRSQPPKRGLPLNPGKGIEYHSKPHVAGTEELVFCHDGQLEVGPEGREERFNSGDALWFLADLPHVYKALKRSDVLTIMSYPPAQGVAR